VSEHSQLNISSSFLILLYCEAINMHYAVKNFFQNFDNFNYLYLEILQGV